VGQIPSTEYYRHLAFPVNVKVGSTKELKAPPVEFAHHGVGNDPVHVVGAQNDGDRLIHGKRMDLGH
ncbi:hypothetical protein NL524_30315, partial [Klebsiella pneumoniae]|nr:hypothetical protein [Klebsiella pneumoniae]